MDPEINIEPSNIDTKTNSPRKHDAGLARNTNSKYYSSQPIRSLLLVCPIEITIQFQENSVPAPESPLSGASVGLRLVGLRWQLLARWAARRRGLWGTLLGRKKWRNCGFKSCLHDLHAWFCCPNAWNTMALSKLWESHEFPEDVIRHPGPKAKCCGGSGGSILGRGHGMDVSVGRPFWCMYLIHSGWYPQYTELNILSYAHVLSVYMYHCVNMLYICIHAPIVSVSLPIQCQRWSFFIGWLTYSSAATWLRTKIIDWQLPKQVKSCCHQLLRPRGKGQPGIGERTRICRCIFCLRLGPLSAGSVQGTSLANSKVRMASWHGHWRTAMRSGGGGPPARYPLNRCHTVTHWVKSRGTVGPAKVTTCAQL